MKTQGFSNMAEHLAQCHQWPGLYKFHMLASLDGHNHCMTLKLVTVFGNDYLRSLDSIFIVYNSHCPLICLSFYFISVFHMGSSLILVDRIGSGHTSLPWYSPQVAVLTLCYSCLGSTKIKIKKKLMELHLGSCDCHVFLMWPCALWM